MAKKSNTLQVVDGMIDETDVLQGADEPVAEFQPTYKMVGDSKIPVPKTLGKLWKSRRDQTRHFLENLGIVKAWEESIRYYKNDHSTMNETDRDPTRETPTTARRFSRRHSETENVVFANVSALVPATYAKNPDIEVTAEEKDELKPFASTCEKLVNVLIRKKIAPGVNLKPKMRRGVVMSTLTNVCFFEVGYTVKEQSSEQAMADLLAISEKYQAAKDIKEIQEIEGQMIALEHRVSILKPSGPFVKFRDMRDVLIDPNANYADLSDAGYVIVGDYVPTEMLRAMYGVKNEKGEWTSIFEPTHILKTSGAEGIEEELMFNPIQSGKKSFSDYGYDDEETFKYSQHTRVWYAWDPATQRVYLWHDDDWSWPLWVWDDPYQLDTFFNLVPLAFYTDPEQIYARSETMYYLDQQDEINKINSEIKRAREFLTGKFMYNEHIIDKDTAEAMMSGTSEKRMIGVKTKDPDASIKDAIIAIELPALAKPELFSKQPYLDAINRLSSVGTVMRNSEYKTNTTNKAIESYESQNQTRLDEKIDAIEDCIGEIGWKMLQLCIRNMTAEEVGQLIGEKHVEIWKEFGRPENMMFLNFQLVGGSALKPTARVKKEEAVQIGQIVGQFASATPAAVIVMLRMFERAFDELTINEADWQLIMQSVMGQMQQPQGGEDGREPSPANGADSGADSGPSSDAGIAGPKVNEVIAQIDKMIDQLPPNVVKEFGNQIAQGKKPSEILRALVNS